MINKFTIIKASPVAPELNLTTKSYYHIFRIIKSSRQPQEGDQIVKLKIKIKIKICAAFFQVRKIEKFATQSSVSPASLSSSNNIQADTDSNDLEDDPAIAPKDSDDNQLDDWQQSINDVAISYLRQSTRNLRFHQPVEAVALKVTSVSKIPSNR